MIEVIERGGQIGVEDLRARFGVGAADGGVDGHDGVVASPARPEPIGFGVEPGLPQRVAYQPLQGLIRDHRNPQTAAASVAFV
ncbi:hypothetical protein [Nocardia wallacei]|uniref:hypothetical protein n=1 Tax=Nocardia wallacei TaxID=480035 RepID=UPI00245561DB|nr:hypothetical protein [Nocardia wallacei]